MKNQEKIWQTLKFSGAATPCGSAFQAITLDSPRNKILYLPMTRYDWTAKRKLQNPGQKIYFKMETPKLPILANHRKRTASSNCPMMDTWPCRKALFYLEEFSIAGICFNHLPGISSIIHIKIDKYLLLSLHFNVESNIVFIYVYISIYISQAS